MPADIADTLRIIPADERFSAFGIHSEPDGSEYIGRGYSCPDGPPGVSFRWRDLANRRQWGTHLLERERQALEPVTRAALGGAPPTVAWRVAVDFRCPRCDRAVVTIFRTEDDSGKGDWTYKPTLVLELDPPSSDPCRALSEQ